MKYCSYVILWQHTLNPFKHQPAKLISPYEHKYKRVSTSHLKRGAVVVVIVWYLDKQLPMQSVTITTGVVSSNLDQGQVTRCTTLCDKVCQWLATDRWFFPGSSFSSTNKTDRHDIHSCSWNIVECGAKHHQTNKQTHLKCRSNSKNNYSI